MHTITSMCQVNIMTDMVWLVLKNKTHVQFEITVPEFFLYGKEDFQILHCIKTSGVVCPPIN